MVRMTRGIIGNPIRATKGESLTNDQLRARVPSIFAESAHESRSDRFAPIATIEVLEQLRDNGYFPFFAVQSTARDVGKAEYTKHMIRLRSAEWLGRSDSNEIILVNANDGTSSYRMTAGKFRFVCQNGLVMGDISSDIRIYHKGTNIISDVIAGADSVLKRFDEIDNHQEKMQNFMMSKTERARMAFATMLSIHGVENITDIPYDPANLLRPRRYEDNQQDMWSTFNVIQENLIKGGIITKRGSRTREVKSIDRDLELNRKVWNTALIMTDSHYDKVTEY